MVDRLQEKEATSISVELPQLAVEELKSALKLADSYTMETIIKYLNLDTYELVKNLAKVTNSTNVAETISYKDGAIGRNDALIKLLRESIKGKTFVNRVKGETEQTRKV